MYMYMTCIVNRISAACTCISVFTLIYQFVLRFVFTICMLVDKNCDSLFSIVHVCYVHPS